MRYLLVAVLTVGIAAQTVAEDGFNYSEYMTFRRAVDSVPRGGTRLAFRLWQCNVAASRRLGVRPVLEKVGLSIEDEAKESMASCAAEFDALAHHAPARQVATTKAAILRANVTVIAVTRTPPTVACAGDLSNLCWRPWRR